MGSGYDMWLNKTHEVIIIPKITLILKEKMFKMFSLKNNSYKILLN